MNGKVCIVTLASSPDMAGVTGRFFKSKRTIDPDAYSKDTEIQRRLWDASAELVGL